MFECDMCGLCCTHLKGKPMYADLDRGDGTCIHYKDKLCSIYSTRPLKCRVDDFYNKFLIKHMTIEEYYERNHKVCNELKATASQFH